MCLCLSSYSYKVVNNHISYNISVITNIFVRCHRNEPYDLLCVCVCVNLVQIPNKIKSFVFNLKREKAYFHHNCIFKYCLIRTCILTTELCKIRLFGLVAFFISINVCDITALHFNKTKYAFLCSVKSQINNNTQRLNEIRQSLKQIIT